MSTSDEPVEFDSKTILTPGDALIRCNGQDITKKGGKARNRIMVILPNQFALPTKLQTDLKLGNLHKLNTECPEFTIETDEGTLTFTGKYVLTTTKFMSIQCNPKKAQNACTDIFDRALVFDEPVLITKHLSRTNSTSTVINEEVSDKLTGEERKLTLPLSSRLGMSALSDPVRKNTVLPSSSSSASRPAANAVFRTSSKSSQRSKTSGHSGSDDADSDDDDYNADDMDDEGEEDSQPVRSSARKTTTVAKSLRDMSGSSGSEDDESDSAHSDSSNPDESRRRQRPVSNSSSAKKTTKPSTPVKRKTPTKTSTIRIDVDDEEDASDHSSPKKRPRSSVASKASQSSTKKPTVASTASKSSLTKAKKKASSDEDSNSDSDASVMEIDLSDTGDRRSSSRRASGSAVKSLKEPSSSEGEGSEEESLQAIVSKGKSQSAAKVKSSLMVKKTPTVVKTNPVAVKAKSSVGKKRLYSSSEEENEHDSDFGESKSKKVVAASAKKAPSSGVDKRKSPASKAKVVDSVITISDSDADTRKNTKTSTSVARRKSAVQNDHSDSDFEALLTTKVSAVVMSPANSAATPRKLVRKFAKSPSSQTTTSSSQRQDVICLDDV